MHSCKTAFGPVFNPRSMTTPGVKHGSSRPQRTYESLDAVVICRPLQRGGHQRFAFSAAIATAARHGAVSRWVTAAPRTLPSLSLSVSLSLPLSLSPSRSLSLPRSLSLSSFEARYLEHCGTASDGDRYRAASMTTAYSTTIRLMPLLPLCLQSELLAQDVAHPHGAPPTCVSLRCHVRWCAEMNGAITCMPCGNHGSNTGPSDLQSDALPAELSQHGRRCSK